MLSFLFWNLYGNNPVDRTDAIRDRLMKLARNFDVDVFIFAESRFVPQTLADQLSTTGKGRYWHSASGSERIQVLTRLGSERVAPQLDASDGRLTIRRLIVPPHELLLAAVHLPSQMHKSETAAGFGVTAVQNDIATIEKKLNNYHTIVVGDMNMNPFSAGMVAAQGFHGVMTKKNTRQRIVDRRRYRCFYNPMWGFFGDRNPGPPGTYHHSGASDIEYHWHVLDQVLLRPELMHALEEVAILDTDGEASLLGRNGRPDSKTASDHLPILFRLRINVTERS